MCIRDRLGTLRTLEGRVQIYLPDLKYAMEEPARALSAAPDYFPVAAAAIREMVRQTGPYVIENGLLRRGVVIRHLVLPGQPENTRRCIDWVSRTFRPGEVLFSLMSQYTPCLLYTSGREEPPHVPRVDGRGDEPVSYTHLDVYKRQVNMVHFEEKAHYDLQDLRQIVHLLRAPGGCPWDAAQTHASLRRQMLEEAWEVVDAIDREDAAALREELGDVLLQVVFHADLEADRGAFTLDDVAYAVCRKMISRHPHVFGDGEALPWEELKRREKGQRSTAQAMEEVAHSLPGLWRAEKMCIRDRCSARAASCGIFS